MYKTGVLHICSINARARWFVFFPPFLFLLLFSQDFQPNYCAFYRIFKSLFIILNFVLFFSVLFCFSDVLFWMCLLLLLWTLNIICISLLRWITNGCTSFWFKQITAKKRMTEMRNLKRNEKKKILQGNENNCSRRVLSCFKHCLSHFSLSVFFPETNYSMHCECAMHARFDCLRLSTLSWKMSKRHLCSHEQLHFVWNP